MFAFFGIPEGSRGAAVDWPVLESEDSRLCRGDEGGLASGVPLRSGVPLGVFPVEGGSKRRRRGLQPCSNCETACLNAGLSTAQFAGHDLGSGVSADLVRCFEDSPEY